jgi:HSP20 family protein
MGSQDDPIHRLQRDAERMLRNIVYHRNLGSHFGDPVWAPATDVVVSGSSAQVIVELAGVLRDEVRVTLLGNLLEIRGCRRPPVPRHQGTHYHRAEIWSGDFRRTIELPWNADAEKVDAVFRDGMLEIQLVPAPTSEHTRVTIEYQRP